jgi:high-affinity iron transporter
VTTAAVRYDENVLDLALKLGVPYLRRMLWADAVPNLLIGLREGLEAGLVVTILLAAARKAARDDARHPTFPVWIGVIGAVSVSVSFAAVLTFASDAVSSQVQQLIGGTLSILAGVLVTWMVFWMRRTARGLSSEISGQVRAAQRIGVGAITVTAFLAVAREGLETTLFLWTAANASRETLAPAVGALIGIVAAVVLCVLIYRGALRINLGVFFTRTAVVLLVITAGILAYGIGDLQDAGILPGHSWIAFDISGTSAGDSWWFAILSGLTTLRATMTVLQVAVWVGYLAVMLPLFLRGARPAPAAPAAAPAVAPAPAVEAVTAPREGPLERWVHAAERHVWLVAGALIVVPAAIAAAVIAFVPPAPSTQTALTITATACAPEWAGVRPTTGNRTFLITNNSGKPAEINLNDAQGAIVAEVEMIGPATTATMSTTLGPGSYSVACFVQGGAKTSSAQVSVTGAAASVPRAVVPVTEAQLTPANTAYIAYADGVLAHLQTTVAGIRAALAAGDLDAARTDWLTAQQDWERVGASYDSFGDLGVAVDGLPQAYPGGVDDPAFTGLHRLEYGLWHGQSAAELVPVAARLAADVDTVRKNLSSPDLAGDPTALPVRAHEVLEDALRDHLSGQDDLGAGAGYALTAADVEVTRSMLAELAPLLASRAPGLVAQLDGELDALASALDAARTTSGGWMSPDAAPLMVRQTINARLGQALETLAAVPDLLEVRPQ